MASPDAFFLAVPVSLTVFFPALTNLGVMLVHAQPTLELLRPALFLGCRVPFAFLRT
ncbi:MAG: hypothetical protein ACRDNF_20820 [Streptosporangiaceae bacterium]